MTHEEKLATAALVAEKLAALRSHKAQYAIRSRTSPLAAPFLQRYLGDAKIPRHQAESLLPFVQAYLGATEQGARSFSLHENRKTLGQLLRTRYDKDENAEQFLIILSRSQPERGKSLHFMSLITFYLSKSRPAVSLVDVVFVFLYRGDMKNLATDVAYQLATLKDKES